jgi:glycosyltransferase involved in cell wall biosynthesis
LGKIIKHTRSRIGLLFTGSVDWVGGIYYIQNIIRSLNFISEEKKPYLLLIPDRKTPPEYISTLGYPYADIFSLRNHTFLRKAYYRIYKAFTSRYRFYDWITEKYELQWLYPFHDFRPALDSVNDKKISWIYDFQHKFFPELFTQNELIRREKEFSLITGKSSKIVVSSYDSLNQLRRFYPDTKAAVTVLQFVSVIEEDKLTSYEVLREKYRLNEPYFIVSNQFWQHKNHFVVLQALKLLKDKGEKVMIVFTGKESDHRNPGYSRILKEFVSHYRLTDRTRFLGFISREDQLGLMQHSLAVIQPSKFEGWGTVVEDAKALQRPVILSDIAVHREQMLDKGYYFPPNSADQLALLLSEFSRPGFVPHASADNYQERLLQFAENFLRIFEITP